MRSSERFDQPRAAMKKRHYNAESLDRAMREFEGAYAMTTVDFDARYRATERLDIPRFDQHTWASFHEDVLRMTDGTGIDRGSVAARAHEAFACR
jgi:hypothetical protein